MSLPGSIGCIKKRRFPNGTGSSARHQSLPDAIFLRSIPGRQAHFDPSKISPQDRDIHLVKLKICPDTNPYRRVL
eukprot:62151-Pelagomonas_calceolata.AAC.1